MRRSELLTAQDHAWCMHGSGCAHEEGHGGSRVQGAVKGTGVVQGGYCHRRPKGCAGILPPPRGLQQHTPHTCISAVSVVTWFPLPGSHITELNEISLVWTKRDLSWGLEAEIVRITSRWNLADTWSQMGHF